MHLTIFNLTWLPAFNLQFCNIEYTLKVNGKGNRYNFNA